MANQTRITIETDSLLVLKGRGSVRGWCPQCQAEGEMISMEDVAGISNQVSSVVEAWIGSDELHYSRSADGTPLICFNSLLKRVLGTTTA